MEFINIPRWSAKDVVDWMKGLDPVLQPYVEVILDSSLTGNKLLDLRAGDLDELGIDKVGHQEIMLDAINLLSNLHYRQSEENLQSASLNLNTRTNRLTKLLNNQSKNGGTHHAPGRNGTSVPQSIPASVLVLVAEIVTAAKTVISWLDRPPFVTGDHFFKVFREEVLKAALELTDIIQQTAPFTQTHPKILEQTEELSSLSDDLVKKSSDPLIIQTSTIDFVSVKKTRSDEELGLEIRTSAIDGTHLITQVKANSASGSTDKIHIGDEILQVNYQTVVGWHHSKVIEALKGNISDITFTLKKRPRHLSQPGQIQRPKQTPFLHPNIVNSLPYRRPSAGNRKRVGVRDDMYLPHREAEKREEEEERPPDTPSIPESPLDSPSVDTSYLPPRGFHLHRRPTMVPGMALLRKGKLARQDRHRSLPDDLDKLSKELNKSLGKDKSKSAKIQPLPADMKFPTVKMNGNKWDTEPMPSTNNDLLPASEERIQPKVAAATSSAPTSQGGKRPSSKGANVSFKDDVVGAQNGNENGVGKSVVNDDVDGRRPAGAADKVEGQRSVENGEELENTNNNEDSEVPKEVIRLIEVVDNLGNDGFVHYMYPGEIDGTNPEKRTGLLVPSASNVSSLSLDSTDGKVRMRVKKPKPSMRNVSCMDLGPGECEGFLYKKSDKSIGNKWSNKMWFVLKDYALYFYKDKTSETAKGILCLPGCKISPATESRRSFAIRITHTGLKDTLLAAGTNNDYRRWLEKLQLASIMQANHSTLRQSKIIFDQIYEKGGYISESTDEDTSSVTTNDDISSRGDSASISTGSPPGSQGGTINSSSEEFQHMEGELRPLPRPRKTNPSMAQAQSGKKRVWNPNRGGQILPSPDNSSPSSSCESSPSSSPTPLRRVNPAHSSHSPQHKGKPSTLNVPAHKAKGWSPRFKTQLSKFTIKHKQITYVLDSNHRGNDEIPNLTEVDEPAPGSSSEVTQVAEENGSVDGAPEAAKDELLQEFKNLDQVAVKGLDRSVSMRNRKVMARPSIKVITGDDRKSYQKIMLLRRLKAKQAELDCVESVLSQPITSDALNDWGEQHRDILRCLVDGRDRDGRDQASSDSDPESVGQEQPLSSSMSSINTTSTTSGQEAATLGDDLTPASDGTTSGCDVQTPLSDTMPPIGEGAEERLKSTSNIEVEGRPAKISSRSSMKIVMETTLDDAAKDSDGVFHDGDSAACAGSGETGSEKTLANGSVRREESGLVRDASTRSESEASETSF